MTKEKRYREIRKFLLNSDYSDIEKHYFDSALYAVENYKKEKKEMSKQEKEYALIKAFTIGDIIAASDDPNCDHLWQVIRKYTRKRKIQYSPFVNLSIFKIGDIEKELLRDPDIAEFLIDKGFIKEVEQEMTYPIGSIWRHNGTNDEHLMLFYKSSDGKAAFMNLSNGEMKIHSKNCVFFTAELTAHKYNISESDIPQSILNYYSYRPHDTACVHSETAILMPND